MKCFLCGKRGTHKMDINDKKFYLCNDCLKKEFKTLLELLFEAVIQCCYDEEKEIIDSFCVSTYAEIINLLSKFGYLKITKRINSRCIVAILNV